MGNVFTKARYDEIYRIVNEAVNDLRNEMNQKFDLLFLLLAKNGIK